MKKLTERQLRHLERRTEIIVMRAIEAFNDEYPEKRLTAQEKVDLIFAGGAIMNRKMVKNKGTFRSVPFVDFFTYKKEKDIKEHNIHIAKMREKLRSKLNKKQLVLMDTVVLNGVSDFGVIQEFEKQCEKVFKKC